MKPKRKRKLPDIVVNSPTLDPRKVELEPCKVAFTLSFNALPAKPKPVAPKRIKR